MKQAPEQVEDQRYVTVPMAPDVTSQVSVTGEAARYSLLVELMDTETLPPVRNEHKYCCMLL